MNFRKRNFFLAHLVVQQIMFMIISNFQFQLYFYSWYSIKSSSIWYPSICNTNRRASFSFTKLFYKEHRIYLCFGCNGVLMQWMYHVILQCFPGFNFLEFSNLIISNFLQNQKHVVLGLYLLFFSRSSSGRWMPTFHTSPQAHLLSPSF